MSLFLLFWTSVLAPSTQYLLQMPDISQAVREGEDEAVKKFEVSEMLLYANQILYESGNLVLFAFRCWPLSTWLFVQEKALRHINDIESRVVDHISHAEAKGIHPDPSALLEKSFPAP